MSSKELGLVVGRAAIGPPSPPRRRLVAAGRLGLVVGLAAISPPSPPPRRLVATRRLGLVVSLEAGRRRCPVAAHIDCII